MSALSHDPSNRLWRAVAQNKLNSAAEIDLIFGSDDKYIKTFHFLVGW